MALFCAAIRRDSATLLKFLLLSQVFSGKISFVCRLKYLYNCFSFRFCFLVIIVLWIIILPVFFLVPVINLSLPFFMLSSSPCIDALTPSSMLVSPLPPSFLDSFRLSMSSFRCKTLCIVISFFCSQVHLSKLFPRPFQEESRVSYKMDSQGVYSFDEIPAAEPCFEKFSRSSEIHFFSFFFHQKEKLNNIPQFTTTFNNFLIFKKVLIIIIIKDSITGSNP